jgi:hypothetical protein
MCARRTRRGTGLAVRCLRSATRADETGIGMHGQNDNPGRRGSASTDLSPMPSRQRSASAPPALSTMRQPSAPPSLILPPVQPVVQPSVQPLVQPSVQPSAQLSQMHVPVSPPQSSLVSPQTQPSSHPPPRLPRSSPSSGEAIRSEHAVAVPQLLTPTQRSQSTSNRNYGTINDDAQRGAHEPLLGPQPAQPPGPTLRNTAHATDVLAAVSSAPYPGSAGPWIQGASGLLWATSGTASGIDNLRQQPTTRTERVVRGVSVFTDVTSALAGIADTANAATNGLLPDAHDWRRGTGQASNALWAVSGLTSMASTGYQTVSNLWNGRPSLSQGLGFASATFNTLGASFGMVANEYQQHDDDASQANATLYGTLSAASWVTGSLFSIASTYAARRQQSASAHPPPSSEV